MTATFTPDFFIIGAPKCGTSALFRYLRDHPALALSREKEPYYYCDDLGDISKVSSPQDYRKLFPAELSGRLSGEGSVWYLYSDRAVPRILAGNKSARFIVMIRDPVDVAYSLHNQLVRTLQEDVDDFATAWSMQEARAEGRDLPTYCPAPALLQYRRSCAIGSQLSRLFERVDRSSVLVLANRDLATSPSLTYKRVLDFLGVQPDGRTEFARVNEARQWRDERVLKFLRHPPGPLAGVMLQLKRRLNAWGIRPLALARPVLTKPGLKPEMPAEIRTRLTSEFREEYELIRELTGYEVRSSTNGGD